LAKSGRIKGMNKSTALENTISPNRILVFIGIITLVFVLYVGRLLYLQVFRHDFYTAKADENRITDINIAAQRGIIYDRNGVVLARNVPSYNIVITQADLPEDPGAIQEIYTELSRLTGKPVNRGEISDANPYVPCVSDHGIAQIVYYGENSTPYEQVRVACDVSREVAMAVEENANKWPGVEVEIVPVRDYPTGVLTSNIVGFLGPIPATQEEYYKGLGFVSNRDKVGYAGIELEFQDLLGGRNGLRVVGRDVAGKVSTDIQPPVQAQPGSNIRLTIDTRLQQAADAILTDEINFWNTWLGETRMTSGVVIAINPKTGEILAMVSYPSYENNRMARLIPAYYFNQLLEDPTEPLRNHAVYAELPAGSVFKLVTATGALNEGVVTPDMVIKTPGKLVVSEKRYVNDPGTAREFVDWIYKDRPEGFVQLDFLHCIANSSNVCFYKVGGGYQDEIDPGLGICRLGTYARALGYGSMPGIELPDKADGLIPDPDWKRLNQGESWTTGDTYIMSVGQGYALATPLQVLMSAATVANDGKLMEPTVVEEILDGEGNVIKPFTPNMRWDLTKDAMIDVYEENSIRGCRTTGAKKTVAPEVFKEVQQGMRLAVTDGTLKNEFKNVTIAVAGKTGTAEYCDKFALEKNRCIPGQWPTHAWTVAYAPYDDPEIAVIAFVYNGGEGATVAGPIVRRMIEAYFELKKVENVR
jgi:penicillin-binding protein 2